MVFTIELDNEDSDFASLDLMNQINKAAEDLLNSINRNELSSLCKKAYCKLLKEDDVDSDESNNNATRHIDPSKVVYHKSLKDIPNSPNHNIISHPQIDIDEYSQEGHNHDSLSSSSLDSDSDEFLINDDTNEEIDALLKDPQYINQHQLSDCSDQEENDQEEPTTLGLSDSFNANSICLTQDEPDESKDCSVIETSSDNSSIEDTYTKTTFPSIESSPSISFASSYEDQGLNNANENLLAGPCTEDDDIIDQPMTNPLATTSSDTIDVLGNPHNNNICINSIHMVHPQQSKTQNPINNHNPPFMQNIRRRSNKFCGTTRSAKYVDSVRSNSDMTNSKESSASPSLHDKNPIEQKNQPRIKMV